MPYLHTTTVLPGDIDELEHASNVRYVQWVLDAAVAHSVAAGFGQTEYFARGQVWVVHRHEVLYLRPALAGDVLAIDTRVTSFSAASSVRCTTLRRAADQAILALGKTTWAYVAKATGRPVRIPEDLRTALPAEDPEPDWLRLWKKD